MMNKVIAANWKMNKTGSEAVDFIAQLQRIFDGKRPADREVIIFPPFTALEKTALSADDVDWVQVGAQDLYPAEKGAFTGEISAEMIRNAGGCIVLTGHSERRHIMGEDDRSVAQKTLFALQHGLKVMLCIGETLEEREQGLLRNVLERQLITAMSFDAGALSDHSFYVAYEPVWAIGTGRTATPSDIAEAHALCRGIMRSIAGERAFSIPLLYGGSVKPSNAGEILSLDNVDGVLVGGASLEADQFSRIITA
jgi:triosephosphate isomerase